MAVVLREYNTIEELYENLTATCGIDFNDSIGNFSGYPIQQSIPSCARESLCGGTGVTYNNQTGEIAIGQNVATTSDVTFNTVCINGSLLSDDITASTVTVCGDLTVTGTTTTVNSSTLEIKDVNITLAKGATTPTQANGGGIYLEGANTCFYYNSIADTWNLDKNLCANLLGQVTDISNHNTDDLAEGVVNLYYTTTRANTDFDTRLGTKTTDDLTEGTINLYYTTTRANTDFDTRFATKTTDDLTEGPNNLYYTDTRADARISNALSGDITVGGNLTVQGTTTTVDSNVVNIGDSIITLNADEIGAPTQDAGIEIQRGTECNVFIKFNETSDIWQYTNDGTTFTNFGTASIFTGNTDGVNEGSTNLYYTDARVDARLQSSSLNTLCDVNLSGLANGCFLAYNSLTCNFEPANPSSNVCININDIYSLSSETFATPETFTADGLTDCFLITQCVDQNSTLVYVNTIWQRPGTDYNIYNNDLCMTTMPDNGDVIYLRYLNRVEVADGSITLNHLAASTYIPVDLFTGDGNTTDFTLSLDPGSTNHLQVVVGGLMQRPGTHFNLVTVNNNPTLRFTAPPANTVEIEAYLIRIATSTNRQYTSSQYVGNGVLTDFVIENGHTVNDVLVFLNGSLIPPNEYTISGTTLQFGDAPLN